MNDSRFLVGSQLLHRRRNHGSAIYALVCYNGVEYYLNLSEGLEALKMGVQVTFSAWWKNLSVRMPVQHVIDMFVKLMEGKIVKSRTSTPEENFLLMFAEVVVKELVGPGYLYLLGLHTVQMSLFPISMDGLVQKELQKWSSSIKKLPKNLKEILFKDLNDMHLQLSSCGTQLLFQNQFSEELKLRSNGLNAYDVVADGNDLMTEAEILGLKTGLITEDLMQQFMVPIESAAAGNLATDPLLLGCTIYTEAVILCYVQNKRDSNTIESTVLPTFRDRTNHVTLSGVIDGNARHGTYEEKFVTMVEEYGNASREQYLNGRKSLWNYRRAFMRKHSGILPNSLFNEGDTSDTVNVTNEEQCISSEWDSLFN